MRKLFCLVFIWFLLTGCGNSIHENIDEKMAADTRQIINIFDTAIKEGRSFTDDESFVVDDYVLLYNAKLNNPDLVVGGLTEEERRLLILTTKMIDMAETLILIESNHESYDSQKDSINNVINTGNIYGN